MPDDQRKCICGGYPSNPYYSRCPEHGTASVSPTPAVMDWPRARAVVEALLDDPEVRAWLIEMGKK